jgi:hypothetical protein
MLKIESNAKDDKKMIMRSGYKCLRTNLLRLGKPSISCVVSKNVIIDKLKQREFLLLADTIQVYDPYDTESRDIMISCGYNSKSYLTREHDPNTIILQKLKHTATKIHSVLMGLDYKRCDGKGNRLWCRCNRLKNQNNRCKTCKTTVQMYGSNPYLKRLIGSRKSGSVPCMCVICMKYRGEWKDNDFCECRNVTIHNPLDMCSNCLCKLAVDEYVFTYSFHRPLNDSLTTFQKIYRTLLHKEKSRWSWKHSHQLLLHNQCVYPERIEDEIRRLSIEIMKIHNTMLALIPHNDANGCNGKGRINACRCPDEQQVCNFCLWWLSNQLKFPSVSHGPIYCSCAKCTPMSAEIQCKCKSNNRGLENLCVCCLCQLALDYDAGKSICFCGKGENQYSCGSDICVNPMQPYDVTKCINSCNDPYNPALITHSPSILSEQNNEIQDEQHRPVYTIL